MEEEWFHKDERYRPKRSDRYDETRRKDYDRDRNDRHRDNYNLIAMIVTTHLATTEGT